MPSLAFGITMNNVVEDMFVIGVYCYHTGTILGGHSAYPGIRGRGRNADSVRKVMGRPNQTDTAFVILETTSVSG